MPAPAPFTVLRALHRQRLKRRAFTFTSARIRNTHL